jgi:hypothetical protein
MAQSAANKDDVFMAVSPTDHRAFLMDALDDGRSPPMIARPGRPVNGGLGRAVWLHKQGPIVIAALF